MEPQQSPAPGSEPEQLPVPIERERLLDGRAITYYSRSTATPGDCTTGAEEAISHLHVEIAPPHRSRDKLKYLVGSETSGGAFLTDVAPEDARARLRAAAPQ